MDILWIICKQNNKPLDIDLANKSVILHLGAQFLDSGCTNGSPYASRRLGRWASEKFVRTSKNLRF